MSRPVLGFAAIAWGVGWAAFSMQVAAAPEIAALAGLDASALERLRGLAMPVAVPTELPPGFRVIDVETQGGDAGRRPRYVIRYGHADGLCFRMESAGGGLGGPAPPPSRWAVYPFAFLPPGAMPWYIHFTAHKARPPFLPYMVFSDWLPRGHWLYRLASGLERGNNCGAIGPALAARVVESLAFLGTDPAMTARAFEPYPYRAFSIRSAVDASAEEAAFAALKKLGLGLAPNAPAKRAARIVAATADAARVLVTYSQLRDDALAARRYRLTLVRDGPRWVLQSLSYQQRCRRGGGQRWTSAPCP